MVAGRMYNLPTCPIYSFPTRNIIPDKVGEKFPLFVKLYNSLSPSFHIGEKSPFSVETLIPGDLSWLHIVFKVYQPPPSYLPAQNVKCRNYF